MATVKKNSGNVFRDLGFENPDDMLAKADLVLEIARAMRQKKMTQANLAKALGIDQPAVSKLLRGRTAGYTADRLMKILNRLGKDVEIKVRAKSVRADFGKVFVQSKEREPKPLTEAYLRKIAAYYENQPKEEALADIDRLFSKEAIVVPKTTVAKRVAAMKAAKAKAAKAKGAGKKTTARKPAVKRTTVKAKAAYAVKPRAAKKVTAKAKPVKVSELKATYSKPRAKPVAKKKTTKRAPRRSK